MSLYTDLLAAGLPVEPLPDGSFTFTRSIDDRETDIYYNILDPQRPIRFAEAVANQQQLNSEYLSTLATLEQIESANSLTNAQVLAAIKLLAKTLRLLLKLIARSL